MVGRAAGFQRAHRVARSDRACGSHVVFRAPADRATVRLAEHATTGAHARHAYAGTRARPRCHRPYDYPDRTRRTDLARRTFAALVQGTARTHRTGRRGDRDAPDRGKKTARRNPDPQAPSPTRRLAVGLQAVARIAGCCNGSPEL